MFSFRAIADVDQGKSVILTVMRDEAFALLAFNETLARLRKTSEPLWAVEIKRYRKKRTLDQNALYWPLVTILTYLVNGEYGGEDDIHEELLRLYSPRLIGKLTGASISKRSKDMNTVEFSSLIEGTFKEIALHGVEAESATEVVRYWKEWHRYRGLQEVDPIQHETLNEYREAVPLCETACGKMGEHIAHIVSQGAGGSDTSDNVLHLCTTCHLEIQHAKGWDFFLEKYPHLRGKVERALKKTKGGE